MNTNLTPIASAMAKALKVVIVPMIASLGLLANSANANTTPIQPAITADLSTENQALNPLIVQIKQQVETAMPFIDGAIQVIPMLGNDIAINDIKEFQQSVLECKNLLLSIEPQYPELATVLWDFVHKTEQLYQALEPSLYKQELDILVSERAYQGKESVGYTFNSAHSFEDFKRMVQG